VVTDTLPAFITDGLYRRYLTPGETVVVVSHRGNAGMLFQADADFYFRIAGGFINASLNSSSALPRPVALLSDPNPTRERGFLSYIHASGVGAIIVERAWSQKWMDIFAKLGLRGTTVGGVIVYRTNSGHVAGLPRAGGANGPRAGWGGGIMVPLGKGGGLRDRAGACHRGGEHGGGRG
jgi:hypothetical protein